MNDLLGMTMSSCRTPTEYEPSLIDERATKIFWEHTPIRSSDDCWEWTGNSFTSKYGNQYGKFWNDKQISSHRYSYELLRGPIPKGYEVHHKCRNTLCVNPHHLEAMTSEDHGILTRVERRQDLFDNLDPEVIRRMWIDECCTLTDLRWHFGISSHEHNNNIRAFMKIHGIPILSLAQRRRNAGR